MLISIAFSGVLCLDFLLFNITATYKVSGSLNICHMISHVTIIFNKQWNNTEYCINTINNFSFSSFPFFLANKKKESFWTLHTIPIKYPILLKPVSVNLIYLEKWQITEYWKNRLNNLDFLWIQRVMQYHFHAVAKYEKISPKASINMKEFGPKRGTYVPVIRWDVAMVTTLIQNLTTRK